MYLSLDMEAKYENKIEGKTLATIEKIKHTKTYVCLEDNLPSDLGGRGFIELIGESHEGFVGTPEDALEGAYDKKDLVAVQKLSGMYGSDVVQLVPYFQEEYLDGLEILLKSAGIDNEELVTSCFCGSLGPIQMLIDAGCKGFDRALAEACSEDRIDVIELLIANGACIDDCPCGRSLKEHQGQL